MNLKENKKWIAISALVLVMVVATAAFAMNGFKGHFGKFHGKEFVKERILSRVDYTMQELELTPDQHAKYAIIRTKMAKGIDAMAERHEAAHDAVHKEMANANPDVKKLAATMKEKVRSMPDSVTLQIDYLLEVYDILTPAQQAELISMFKDHMNDKDGRKGLWHGRDHDRDRS